MWRSTPRRLKSLFTSRSAGTRSARRSRTTAWASTSRRFRATRTNGTTSACGGSSNGRGSSEAMPRSNRKRAEAPASRSRYRSGRRRPAMERIKVLIVDDHRVVREGLSAILKNKENLDVVGEAQDGQEAVEHARTLDPDVVL